MAKKIARADLIDAERTAWSEVDKRIDFLVNASGTHTDKILIDEAAKKVSEAISNYMPLYKHRAQVEFETK